MSSLTRSLFTENKLLRAEVVSLQKENASLKDEDAFSQTVIAEQGRKIDDLTQQLAAANGRVAELESALQSEVMAHRDTLQHGEAL